MTAPSYPRTTDLSDAHPELQVCEPVFSDFGKRRGFFGSIATLKVFEDNALVRAALETAGAGRVLVVDGGGSLRCALLGGMLGKLAVDNGWSGVVVHGCVRDVAELAEHEVGIKALAPHPRQEREGNPRWSGRSRRSLCGRDLSAWRVALRRPRRRRRLRQARPRLRRPRLAGRRLSAGSVDELAEP